MIVLVFLLIVITGMVILTLGLCQAAGKEMPKPDNRFQESNDTEHKKDGEPLDRIANDREMW